jgi:hypothetical protein
LDERSEVARSERLGIADLVGAERSALSKEVLRTRLRSRAELLTSRQIALYLDPVCVKLLPHGHPVLARAGPKLLACRRPGLQALRPEILRLLHPIGAQLLTAGDATLRPYSI